jgi:methylated-DNA-[protein]-cysteine S-methyltransferase
MAGGNKATPKRMKTKPATKSPTPFQNRVYDACKQIPAGKVTTYGALSAVLKSSPRAVGQALRCNPYAPIVPCHRVIASTLELGGFTGSWGIGTPSVQKKKAMLEKEGVKFSADGKLIDKKAVLSAAELASLVEISSHS